MVTLNQNVYKYQTGHVCVTDVFLLCQLSYIDFTR